MPREDSRARCVSILETRALLAPMTATRSTSSRLLPERGTRRETPTGRRSPRPRTRSRTAARDGRRTTSARASSSSARASGRAASRVRVAVPSDMRAARPARTLCKGAVRQRTRRKRSRPPHFHQCGYSAQVRELRGNALASCQHRRGDACVGGFKRLYPLNFTAGERSDR